MYTRLTSLQSSYVLRVLQLQYLRRLPDPLGPSTLTFPPSFSPYLESSDLSNPAVWPELDLVRAPKPVGSERIPGVGGLKYSETIVGKNGGFSAGMRVRGRRRTFKSRQNRAGSLRHDEAPKMLNPVNEHEEVPEGAEADAEDQAASSDDNEDAESRALKLNAPKVTIQSPQRSPTTPTSGDPTTIQAKNPRRNTLQSISERFKSVEDLVNPEESDPEQDAVPQDQLSRRSRPVTLLHTPEYSHDKELSDALLWQEDRDRYQNRSGITNDLDSPSLTSPIVPGPSSPTEGSATEDVEPSTADTQQSRLGAMLAQSQVDPSSFSYSGLGNDSASTSYNIANSSASIMEGASSAALQSRRAGRLRRGPSEPELARFKDTPPPTQNPEPQKQQQSSKPILPLDLQQAPPPPPPMVGLQPGQRRERRRVNVSGKIALAAHPPPPPPPQAQVQEPIPSNVPTSSQAPDPRTGVAEAVGSGQLGKITSSPSRLRSRAGTDPPPSALASASKTEALYARRQASSDAPQPTASTLGRPIGPREPSNQQAKSGPNTDRTSPLKPLALLSPKPVEDRHSLSSRATSSPAPLKFEKTPIAPPNAVKEPKSNLSAILTAQESSATCVNPFNAFYGAVLTRPGDSSGLSLKLFFSYAGGTSAKFSVKKDATAEEVIGCALFKYWELDLKPTLLSDAEKEAWDGESLSGKLDPASWNLHIVEDEDTGEVDDDFPGKSPRSFCRGGKC